MFKEDPRHKDSPVQLDGEGWLVSDQQQQGVRFKNDMATAHAEWVTLATYSWKPPSPLVPMTQRRMLRHNAIEAWTLRKRWAGGHATHQSADLS